MTDSCFSRTTASLAGEEVCHATLGNVPMRAEPIRAHGSWTLRLICWLAVLLFFLFVIGCGGGGSRASEAEIQAAMKARAEKDAQEKKKREEAAKKRELAMRQKEIAAAKKKREKEEAIRSRNRAAVKDSVKQAPKRPTFPEKVADWRKDDYYTARAWGEPRFAEAVVHLGREFAGSENAARLLSNLLRPQEPKEDTPRGPTRGRNVAEQVDTLVAALFENGTDVAWETLEQLALGTFPAENAKEAREAAVRLFLANPSKRSEDVVFELLSRTNEMLPTRPNTATRDRLRPTILSAIGSDVRWDSLRVRLAERMAGSSTDYARMDQLRRLLEQPVLANLPAQLVLYKGVGPSADTRERMEAFFGRCCERALRTAFEVPNAGNRAQASRTPLRGSRSNITRAELSDSERLAYVARHLWSPASAAIVVRRLQQIDSLPTSLPLLGLAVTMPVDRVRWALSETLARNWEDGPPNLVGIGGTGADAMCDPAMIVIVKGILADRDPSGGGSLARKRNTAATRTRPVSQRAQWQETRRREEELARKWWQACGKVVLRLCGQMEAAGVASRLAGETSDPVDWTAELLELHPDARVVAEHRIALPSRLPAGIADACPSPIRVTYFRVEERGNPRAILKFYERQLRDAKSHVGPDGVWLSVLRDEPESGVRHSLDVLVRAGGSGLHASGDGEQRLSVDVLCVTIERQTAESTVSRPSERTDAIVVDRPEAG